MRGGEVFRPSEDAEERFSLRLSSLMLALCTQREWEEPLPCGHCPLGWTSRLIELGTLTCLLCWLASPPLSASVQVQRDGSSAAAPVPTSAWADSRGRFWQPAPTRLHAALAAWGPHHPLGHLSLEQPSAP